MTLVALTSVRTGDHGGDDGVVGTFAGRYDVRVVCIQRKPMATILWAKVDTPSS